MRMARMNISLPDPLKAHMDTVASEVNWSQVATEAFEVKLGALAVERAKHDMQAVIDRLRASKRSQETQEFQDGHRAGVAWAKEKAPYKALKNLHDWWKVRVYDVQGARQHPATWREIVVAALGEDPLALSPDGKRRADLRGLDRAIGCGPDDLPVPPEERTPDWMAGFANGAFTVFRFIENDL